MNELHAVSLAMVVAAVLTVIIVYFSPKRPPYETECIEGYVFVRTSSNQLTQLLTDSGKGVKCNVEQEPQK